MSLNPKTNTICNGDGIQCANFKVQYSDNGQISECDILFTDGTKALKLAKSTKKQHELTRVVGQPYDGKPWYTHWCSSYDDRGLPVFR